ncbi:alpha/beta-hydrolase [Hyaloscypha variabilis]
MYLILSLLSYLLTATLAQYPPVSNLTTISSPFDENITISYKSPGTDACQTAFDTQQQYTGWVHIPGTYPTNTFFWFFGARQPTEQLTIWLNGGPGASSMIGLFTENGPCEVVELGVGKLGTIVRDWGWDRGSNLLYIDQPNQVGFSYDTPTNCSLDLLTSDLYTPQQVLPKSQPADTFLNGTFSSLNANNTANTTEIAGMAIWHMLQGFLGAFPEFGPSNSSVLGVHLFAESYGGKYGPAFATIWEEQNLRRSNGSIARNTTVDIKLLSLGIVNGCVDDIVQGPFYPDMAVNNTYGLTIINPTVASLASGSFYAPGGCQQQINQCRTAVADQDPENSGDVSAVNSVCSNAYNFCYENVVQPYVDAGRSVYDIAHFTPDPFPPSTYLEYLNTAAVQSAIGSQLNYTQTNQQVVSAFSSTGDYERLAPIPDIAALVRAGIRVGLIYGDRDYICNWLGGEAISLAVAAETSAAYASSFPAAGYAPIIVNTSYIGGVVRQYGNLSFSRIYDAGHSVPAYQPETAFQVFARIMTGTSLSTGAAVDLSSYDTTGPLDSTYTNSAPASPSPTCWLRNIPDTCNNDQRNMVINNEGVIINGVLYDASSDWSSATSTASATAARGTSVTVTTSTEVLTGFFTATSTPTPSKKSFGVSSVSVNVEILGITIFGALAPFVLS